MSRHTVLWNDKTALPLLARIRDKRVQRLILKRADQLSADPKLQGKPLRKKLAGLHSVRAVGQRYRIVYEINDADLTVWIVAVGIRKEGSKNDIYHIAQKSIS